MSKLVPDSTRAAASDPARAALASAIDGFTSGVAVVATQNCTDVRSELATGLARISSDPPLLIVSLKRDSRMGEQLIATGHFVLSVLGGVWSEMFVCDPASFRDRRSGTHTDGPVVIVECDLVDDLSTNVYTAFVARPVLACDPTRHSVAMRGIGLALSRSAMRHAKSYIDGHGPVIADTGDPTGARQRRLDRVTEIQRIREELELAAIAQAMGQISESQLAEARAMLAQLRTRTLSGEAVAAVDWVPARKSFLEFIVSLSGSDELLQIYRMLNAQGAVSELHVTTLRDGPVALDTDLPHRRLVEALQNRDLSAAVEAVCSHTQDTLTHLRSAGGVASVTPREAG